MEMTIKACRAQVRVSADELGKAIGVTKDTIYAWETGKRSPSIKYAFKIVDFFNKQGLGVTLNDINFLP